MIPILVSVAVAGASVPASPEEADAAYRAGIEARADAARARPQFRRAAEGYEAAWATGPRSPALARNMAQSRSLAGDLAGSIRDYRRGLREFPHDPELRAGLAFARNQVAYPHTGDLADAARLREAETPLDRVPVSFQRLAWAAVVVAAFGWLTLARGWLGARGGLALTGGALILTGASLGAWLWWEDGKLRSRWAEPTAVVTGSGADLRMGNSDEYPKRLDGRLPAGAELKVVGERGGWLHVELAGGAVGWVPKGRVVEVE
jgi:hypothetical protein